MADEEDEEDEEGEEGEEDEDEEGEEGEAEEEDEEGGSDKRKIYLAIVIGLAMISFCGLFSVLGILIGLTIKIKDVNVTLVQTISISTNVSSVEMDSAIVAAKHAVDGYKEGLCATTRDTKAPWIRITLLDTYVIESVLLWPNTNKAYKYHDLEVRVGPWKDTTEIMPDLFYENGLCDKKDGKIKVKKKKPIVFECPEFMAGNFMSVQVVKQIPESLNNLSICLLTALGYVVENGENGDKTGDETGTLSS